MKMRLSLSAFPGLNSPVMIAHMASAIYLKLMGRLSKASSSWGAKRVNVILQGNLRCSRSGLSARATHFCCALCLACFRRQGSKQLASLLVCNGSSNSTFPSETSDLAFILAAVRFFFLTGTLVLPDPFCELGTPLLCEFRPFKFLFIASKRQVVAFNNCTP